MLRNFLVLSLGVFLTSGAVSGKIFDFTRPSWATKHPDHHLPTKVPTTDKAAIYTLPYSDSTTKPPVTFYWSKEEKKSGGGAIAMSGKECAEMGKKIADDGGSAADVAVAMIVCEGLTCPHASGMGGGFMATIYTKATGKVETLNARETAPAAATEEMFKNDGMAAQRGGKAVAVIGELKGIWELHQKYGKLPWEKVIQPNVDLARNGHEVTPHLEQVLKTFSEDIHNEPTLSEIYVDPKTNETWKAGDIVKRPQFAKALEVIQKEGADAIHGGGSLMQGLVDEIKERGGIITKEDFTNYKVIWGDSVSTTLKDGSTYHSAPLPSSGAIVCFMLNILADYDLKDDALSYHRIVEAMKFAYAKRTLLGDDQSDEIKELVKNLTSVEYANEIKKNISDEKTFNDFAYYGANFSNPEDSGTAHISILMPNGDAISVTTTINYIFGAFWRSKSTGIILNDQMDDFSTPGVVNAYGLPPSPANFIKPGKHPLSSISPAMLIDKNGDVKMVIGGAGGSQIPSEVAYSVIKHLYMGETLTGGIAAPRLHHQLAPMEIYYETAFDQKIINTLNQTFGHSIKENNKNDGFGAVTGISKLKGEIDASFDPRRGGSVQIF